MKTLQDCKDRVAKRNEWDNWDETDKFPASQILLLKDAAELYGRYMRFVGRSQMREGLERENTRLIMKLAAIGSYANKPTMSREELAKKIDSIIKEVAQ